MTKSNFIKNYGATLLLLLGLLAGGVVGAFWPEGTRYLRPIGTLFLNLIFVLVVPLVFLSVAHSMITMRAHGVVGKVLGTALAVFIGMSLVTGLFTYSLMWAWNPFSSLQGSAEALSGGLLGEGIAPGEALVAAFTVSDFPLLLSREHLLPLVVFSALFGLAIAALGPSARAMKSFVTEGAAVIMKMMELVMKLAPVGLGCYFADTIGQLGGQIVGDYLEVFLVVCLAAAVCYFLFQSLYVLFCGIPLRKFWKEMIPPSATAMGTCSSAASMPVSMASAKRLGVSDNIVEGVIPLGTNLHKDGSVVTTIAKVLFALYIFGMAPEGMGTGIVIVCMALLVSMVVGAVPVGGMTGEILICAILGIDPSFAATLLVIGTICDIPATVLNVSGNLVASLLVQRFSGSKGGVDREYPQQEAGEGFGDGEKEGRAEADGLQA